MATESIALEASLTRPLGGRYRLDEVVGRGGMGTVYRALDLRLNRAVAIKVLRSVEHADTIRFEAEIEILARLVHPGLVRLLDAGEVGLHPYLVMDLVEGPSLAQRVSEGPLRREETATIGSRIAAALAYVHDAHVIHRDVKPANVLLANSGDVHLADFGIARLVDSTSITVTGRALGTPAYLAPEQVEGTSVGPGTDVYALGLVLIECLSGRRAFEGSPSEIAAARLHRDPAIPWEVGEGWRHTLSAMTQRSLADRLSADDAVAQLSLLASVDTYIASITDPWDDGVVTAPLAGAASSPSPAAMTQLLPHAPVGARARVVRPRLRVTRAGARVIALGAVGVALVTFLVVAAPWSSSPAPTTAAIASHLRAPA
nr:serine/threonine protein kinase [Acidobacteriota bacterium]